MGSDSAKTDVVKEAVEKPATSDVNVQKGAIAEPGTQQVWNRAQRLAQVDAQSPSDVQRARTGEPVVSSFGIDGLDGSGTAVASQKASSQEQQAKVEPVSVSDEKAASLARQSSDAQVASSPEFGSEHKNIQEIRDGKYFLRVNEPVADVAQSSDLLERLGRLPLDKQAQVIGAGLVAFSNESRRQQFEITVATAVGIKDGAVDLAKGATDTVKQLGEVWQWSQEVMLNDPAAVDKAGRAGEAIGKTLVGGVRLWQMADDYLGKVGASGDYAKPFQDISWLGQKIDERWAALTPAQQAQLTAKLSTEVLGGVALPLGTSKIAKSEKLTTALEQLAVRSRDLGAGAKEKTVEFISRFIDDVMRPPGSQMQLAHATAYGGGERPPGALSKIGEKIADFISERRRFQSKVDGRDLQPIEAARESAKVRGEKFDEQEWKKLKPEEQDRRLIKVEQYTAIEDRAYLFQENGTARVLKDDEMAKRLGIRVEDLRKRTAAELEQLGLKAIEPVGAGLPINCEYAGRVYFEQLSDRLKLKYPDGVRFNEKGFPEFSPYARETRPVVLTGDRAKDFQAADKLAGIDQDYREKHKLLWHHREDVVQSADGVVCQMELIPRDLHDAVRHTGGCATSGLDYK